MSDELFECALYKYFVCNPQPILQSVQVQLSNLEKFEDVGVRGISAELRLGPFCTIMMTLDDHNLVDSLKKLVAVQRKAVVWFVRHTDFCVEKRVADPPCRVRRAIDSGLR